MRIIKPGFEIIQQLYPNTIIGLQQELSKHIEAIGRVCYKSEDKITEDSHEKFVRMLKDRKHGAMLEHGTVYLLVRDVPRETDFTMKYQMNRYSVVHEVPIAELDELGNFLSDFYITTNYRVIIENGWEEDLSYMTTPLKQHSKRISVKFTIDRGVSHEFVRNRGSRGNAFAQESTRYVNYAGDKQGNECTFIEPCFLNAENFKEQSYNWHQAMRLAEETYLFMIKNGAQPQQARSVLPNSTKTELVMTCYDFDWEHFFNLRRVSPPAHPQASEVAAPVEQEMLRLGLIGIKLEQKDEVR